MILKLRSKNIVTFNKRPCKRPGDLLNITIDATRPALWKRFRSRIRFGHRGPLRPPSNQLVYEEIQPTQNFVSFQRQMEINDSARNDSSTDTFESVTPDNRSITGTDGSVGENQEETDDFNFH